MKLYYKHLLVHLKSQMQYKSSFFLTIIGQFIVSFSAFLSVIFLMSRFHEVKGFTVNEVLLCFGVILISFSIAECFVRGFDTFSSTISNGEFDRIMVRPRNEMLLVLCSKIELSRIGRFTQAMCVFVYAVPASGINWTSGKLAVLALMLISGVTLFSGLFIIYASLCFFTIEGLEFMNIFTDGGKEFGAYPIGVYGKRILRFFTYIVPLAMVQYYPFLYLTGKTENIMCIFTPLASFVFLVPCCVLWRIGVRHYKSTGS